MPKKQSQKDDLSTNQEHIIAFLVIALFGLMYWFFMHGNDATVDADLTPATPQVTSVNVAEENSDIHSKPENTTKNDEVQARRDAAIALEETEAKEAQNTKLLANASMTEESLRESLSEQQIQLIIEKKLNKEITEKLELEKNARIDAENNALQLTGEGTQKIAAVSEKVEDAEQLVEAERTKAESLAQQLKDTELLVATERNKAQEATDKLTEINQLVEAERVKSEAAAQQLAEANQLIEAEREKAAEAAQQLEMAQKLAELESAKAIENALKLTQFKEQQTALNESKVSALSASIDAERMKAEQMVQALAEAKQEAENERLKAQEAAKALTQLTQNEASKAELLVASVEEERLKAEAIAKQLEEAKLAAEADRVKAEQTALKLAEAEKLKAEEESRRLEEEQQRKLAEAERSKAEQALAEIKQREAEEKARQKAKEKSELNARIKLAQETLVLKERERLAFSLANGKAVQIDPNGFANKVKTSIIDGNLDQPISFDKINFSSGSTNLNRESIKQVEAVASVLSVYENNRILLRGHTDNVGDESKNVTLSLGRSLKLKNALIALGIKSDRISVEGVGSQQPIADNTSKAGRRENRRIDLILLK